MQSVDSNERIFYSAQGTFLAPQIPASLGGVYLFCDGPVGEVGKAVGTVRVTWHLQFKGVRTTDNVVPPSLSVRKKMEWADMSSSSEEEASEVILLKGKQYVRVGEAKNPGPEAGIGSDDDEEL